MIGENITIEGLERLFSIFPRDFAFEGAYLKGVLLHENGVIQLTYSIIDKANDKTYLFVFICSECKCKDDYKLQVPTNRNSVSELNIRYADDKHKDLCFLDTTNGITITCQNMKIDTYVILSKANAKHQAHKLTHDYFEEIQKKFNDFCLLKPLSNGEPLFRRDDSYNGIPASHHSMYKLRDLHNKDNSIVYEFLIEFDRNDPCLGIYYGCNALIKKGDSNEQQAIISNEWNKNIKPGVQRRLDNIFPGKKFGYRFKPTDNANDNTFWPFWISLYADENILEVAVRATIIIRDEYKRYLEGEKNYNRDEISQYVLPVNMKGMIEKRGGEAHSETRFTEESYNELLEKLGSGKQSSWSKKKEQTPISLFERFLQNAHNENYIVQDTTYEKAWSLNMAILNGADFSLLLQTLFNNEKFKSLGIKRTPWVNLAKIFLNVNGMPFPERGLENQTRQKQGGNEGNKAKERMKRIVDQLLQEN